MHPPNDKTFRPFPTYEAKSKAAIGVKYAPFFASRTVAPSNFPSVGHALSSGIAYSISRAFPNKHENARTCK